MAEKKLKILLVSAEVAPFAKVGGLADVAGALPKALKAMGHDVRVVMPCYKMIETNPAYGVEEVLGAFPVPVHDAVVEEAFVKRTYIHSHKTEPVPVYLLGNTGPIGETPAHTGYFQEATESSKVYTLEPDPYIFFCRGVLEMLTHLEDGWQPDIIHCNDWQSGLVPVYARQFYADNAAIKQAACVFTIHNQAYQGNFGGEHWYKTGLPNSLYNVDGLEYYGEWNFMKGGLLFSERVNTVSENYACEIQTPEYGCGLDGLMRTLFRQGVLRGIVNGIDYEEYNPVTDPHITAKFSAEDSSGKALCKAALQEEFGLPKRPPTALIGLISRLADQKGFDLIANIAEQMLELPVQFVLLGSGDPRYAEFFTKLQEKYPEQVRACIKFDVELAQRIYSSSDLFLMPSRYEPCGLGQMFALRYGTIPVVRATGGLADTVLDFDAEFCPDGNGFVFSDYSSEALLSTIRRAVGVWSEQTHWPGMVQRALQSDFSWERSAKQYDAFFHEAVSLRSEKQV